MLYQSHMKIYATTFSSYCSTHYITMIPNNTALTTTFNTSHSHFLCICVFVLRLTSSQQLFDIFILRVSRILREKRLSYDHKLEHRKRQ